MSNLLQEAFPQVDPGVQPLGSRVLVQIKTPMSKTRGGILLTTADRDTEKANTQVAKIISVGRLAFHNRNTAEIWPEGAWCQPGQFVRVPRYGGDRWEVDFNDTDKALFVLFNDLDLLGVVTDPTNLKAFY